MLADILKLTTITESDYVRIFGYMRNLLDVEPEVKMRNAALFDYIASLPPINPWEFPLEVTVDRFSEFDLIQLNKWIQAIDDIQPAHVAFGLSVNPGGLSGVLRAPRYFFIRWTLNGVKLELAAGKPFLRVAEVFDEFMRIIRRPDSIEKYKPIRPFPLHIDQTTIGNGSDNNRRIVVKLEYS